MRRQALDTPPVCNTHAWQKGQGGGGEGGVNSAFTVIFFSTGVKNWFEVARVSNYRGLERSGAKLQSKREANPRESTIRPSYREVRDTEGSKNRESIVDRCKNG